MGEGDRGTVTDVRGDLVAIDVGLQLVRRGDHQEVGPLGGIGHRHDLQAVGLDLLGRRRARTQGDDDVLGAGVLEVERMGPALRAVADDDDLLALDQVEIGITIIINAHVIFLPRQWRS